MNISCVKIEVEIVDSCSCKLGTDAWVIETDGSSILDFDSVLELSSSELALVDCKLIVLAHFL